MRKFAAALEADGWRVAYSLDFGYKTLDRDVRANTLAALEVLWKRPAYQSALHLHRHQEFHS